MFRDCDKTHYYRFNDFNGPTPEQEAIAELQEDVERIDGEIEDINSDIDRIDDTIEGLTVHKHYSNVARYYCATYGSDDNDGSQEHPFRSMKPIFDPDKSLVNFNDTAIKITFLDVGRFEAYSEYQEWPWYNGVFIRFVGPTRTTMPAAASDLPEIIFNCHACSFSNSYFASDYVRFTVGTGQYDTVNGEAYNRFHFNNTSLICNLTYFNESCHAPHCGSGSYRDCVMNKFACTGYQADFEHNIPGNSNALVIANSDGSRSAISCSTSMIRINGYLKIKQPDSNISPSMIVNKSCYMCIGENVSYYGDGNGKYNRGLTIGTGTLVIRRNRLQQIVDMGVNGTEEAGANLYVHGVAHIDDID